MSSTGAGSGAITRRGVLQFGAIGGLTIAGLTACAPGPPIPKPRSSEWHPTADPMPFPKDFIWGAATSAYQVEGSTKADGRGVSIWDTFSALPWTIVDHSSGEPAADHYRLWEEDLDLMSSLGLDAYRFSIAWPRIIPLGAGAVNQTGMHFYRGLVDGLVKRGIRPAITLYHWDLPQPLQDAGGWAARATATRFAEYARVMFDALGDVEADWFTINEPKTTAFSGYRDGVHAPGIKDADAAAAAVHHQLLAHGLAVQQFRASGAKGRIGIALNLMPVYSTSAAAKAATRIVDSVENRLFLDPVLLGRYPKDAIGGLSGQLPADPATFAALIHPGDLDVISTKSDLLAVQYYGVTGVDANGSEVGLYPTSLASWQQIYPEGLYDLLTRITKDYPKIPLVITENGMPDKTANLTTDDPYRITFLRDHFIQSSRAISVGVPLIGHFVWSLLDNFEWAEGYTQRWGIVAVDFESQKRTPKKSASFLSSVITANAVPTH